MAETIIRPGAPVSGRLTPASFPFYTSGEDNLRITSFNAAGGVHLKVNARLLNARGEAVPQSWDHTPNSDRSAKSDDLTLSGLTLLNVTIFASAGAPLIGQTFVILQLIRGTGAAALLLGTILQGYVTTQQALAWPGSPIQTSIESGGALRQVTGTQPAFGGEIAETVPVGARWELIAFRAALATSAVAATRRPKLNLQPSSGNFVLIGNPGTLIAGQTDNFYWAQGLPFETLVSPAANTSGLPTNASLLVGFFIGTATGGMDAGDRWSAPTLIVREWLEVM